MEAKLGRLLPLLAIDIQSGIVQALSHFWCPQTSTYICGKHELISTLKEYNIAIRKLLEFKLVSSPIRIEPISVLSAFLRVNENEMKRVFKYNCNACPLSFLTRCSSNAPTFQMSRILLLAFFRFVFFSCRKNVINPSIAWVVRQVCIGMYFVNTILAEIFLSLTWFKQNEEKTFHALAELLQIWFFSHIKGFGIHMVYIRLMNIIIPLQNLETLNIVLPIFLNQNG